MTENEAIKELETSIELAKMCTQNSERKSEIEAYNTAIEALEKQTMVNELLHEYKESENELEQYRAIGTVEEIQKKMEELERWHTDRINENIKNPFAYTSTSICHNCDHKDEYIEELESEVSEYKTIGTIEELQELKEKNTPEKPFVVPTDDTCLYHEYRCPSCNEWLTKITDDAQLDSRTKCNYQWGEWLQSEA